MKIAVISAVFSLCSFSLPQIAKAETIDCGAGDVRCLIAAIYQANADPYGTIIRLAGGTYVLTTIENDTDGANGLPSIESPVKIEGGDSGATLAREAGAPPFRLLHIGPTGKLTLDRLTLTGGGSIQIQGGAIFNDHGTLKVFNTTIAFNRGPALVNAGGAVALTRTVFDRNFGTSVGALLSTDNGQVRIHQSHFIHNIVNFEASGIYAESGTILIDRTSFTGNVADGGAIWVDRATVDIGDTAFVENIAGEGGAAVILNLLGIVTATNATVARNGGSHGCGPIVSNFGTMTFVNSTFADNINDRCAVPTVGGILIASRSGSTTVLQNTIVLHDEDKGIKRLCTGVVTSLGNNLIDDPGSCSITLQVTDLIGEADLGTFTDDGTPGNAHFPLLPASQAIDAANNDACPKKDQVGKPRTPNCDIGAVEFR